MKALACLIALAVWVTGVAPVRAESHRNGDGGPIIVGEGSGASEDTAWDESTESANAPAKLDTPAALHDYFVSLSLALRSGRQAVDLAAELGVIDRARADELRSLLEYRLTLVERYLDIHALFESSNLLQMPGVPDPQNPGPRPLSREDIFAVANAYTLLLQEPAPHFWRGVIRTDITWNRVDGAPLYFGTEHESAVVATALRYIPIADQRARIRRRLRLMSEITMDALHFIPGGSIAENAYVAANGETLYGEPVGTLERVLAVVEIGGEVSEVLVPILRARIRAAGSRSGGSGSGLNSANLDEVSRYLRDRDGLARRLNANADPGDSVSLRNEIIQEDWVRHIDALADRQSSRIALNRSSFDADGNVLPDRGIDNYAFPGRRAADQIGIVREMKVTERPFEGWRRSWAQIRPRAMSTPEFKALLRDTPDANLHAHSLSWAWIADRAIAGHRSALDRMADAAGETARQTARHEAAAARDLMERLVNGQLKREHHVMQTNGEVFIATERVIAETGLIQEELPYDVVVGAVRKYLQTLD